MRRYLCIVSVCIIILSLLSAYSSDKYGMEYEEITAASSIALNEADAEKLSDKVPILLYFANEDYSKLKLEIRYIPMSEAKKSVNHLAEIIVTEVIKGPKVSGMQATVPVETKLHSKIKIDGEVATLDLSKEFKDNHPGGKPQETMAIYSIVNSLTELKEINKVKFLIEGKSSPEFKGNFKFDKIFPRSAPLISKKTDPVTTDSKDNSGNVESDKKEELKEKNKENEVDVSSEVKDEDVMFYINDEEIEETFNQDTQETYIDFD